MSARAPASSRSPAIGPPTERIVSHARLFRLPGHVQGGRSDVPVSPPRSPNSEHGVDLARLPFSLKILLENLLRNEDDVTVTRDDILGLARWDPKAIPNLEIAFRPSRVLLQDFTGGPAVVDLAAMRDAMKRMGDDPKKINPPQPVEPGHRPLGPGRRGRQRARLQDQRRAGIRPQPRAIRFLRWGQDAFRTSGPSRPTPASSTRSTSNTLARVVFSLVRRGGAGQGVRAPDLSGHAGRHRPRTRP